MTLPTNNGILRPGISDLQFMHPTNLTDPLMKEFYRLFLIFLLFIVGYPAFAADALKMFGYCFGYRDLYPLASIIWPAEAVYFFYLALYLQPGSGTS
jgi:hypothetical protein